MNGVIVDIHDGGRIDHVDAGHALAMTTGNDGKLYAATVGACQGSTVIVRRIDPVTMRQEAAINTGRVPAVLWTRLIAAVGGATYLHEVTATAATLLRIDGASVSTISLPLDSGIFSTAAPDGTIYLYGGRARSVVTRFDPATASLVVVDAAQGPSGATVGALFFRSD